MKLLLIDCQVFQTPAWHRGMGKYSLELLHSLLKDQQFNRDRKVVLLFSSHLPFSTEVQAEVARVAPQAEIVQLDLKIRKDNSFLPDLLKRNQRYIDEVIAKKYAAYDIEFLILSLFLVESATSFPTKAKKIVLVYDLIMLQFFEMYLGLGPSSQHFGHYKTLFEADLYLTISETVANDLVTTLGIDESRIVSIDGGPITRTVIEDTNFQNVVQAPFILMPTGGDFRKNNHRGVRGFEMFNQKHNNQYKLVLTSTFGAGMVHELNGLSDNLVFTGNITEGELAWYYEHAEGILFPSEYEGLGLPILEAIDFNKPVACSDISVFREISSRALYYFDPYSIVQIAETLEAMINRVGWVEKQQYYSAVLEEYSWTQSTSILAAAIEKTLFTDRRASLPRRAVVTPNIKIDNSLCRFVAMQFANLSRDNDLAYYYDLGVKPRPIRPNHLAFSAAGLELSTLGKAEHAQFDSVEYNLANNTGSIHTLMKALALPGEIILHSPNYEQLYRHARRLDYISDARLQAEAYLADTLGDRRWLVSLLRASTVVKVYDKDLYAAAQKLITALGLEIKVILLDFPVHSLPYTVAKVKPEALRVGLVVGKDLAGAKQAFALAQGHWGDKTVFKIFLDGLKEDKYYEQLGLDYPQFLPQIGSSDYRLEAFMQQIDVLYSFEDAAETVTKFMEHNAAAHSVEIVRL